MRRYLLAPLIFTLLSPVQADEFTDNWFNNNVLRKQLSKTHNISPDSINDENIDQARSGACEAYVEYNQLPSKKIKASCIKIYKKWGSKYKYS